MTASYSKLMLDHGRIDHLCRMLVDDVSMLGKDDAEYRKYPEKLTGLISENTKVERFIILTVQRIWVPKSGIADCPILLRE